MERYEYRVVPFIGAIKKKENAGHVSAQLQSIINEHADSGFEFHSFGEVNIAINQGCIASLIGRGTEYTKFDQLVFRRPV